jgi:hypothetical protein
MDAQRWLILAVVVIVVAVIAYLRSKQRQERQTQDRRMGAQEQGRAHSAGEEISQREERRLSGMTAEDRAWEQASLQRNQHAQVRARRANGPEDHH